jgi:hypothetical protein
VGTPGYQVAAEDLTKFATSLTQDGDRYKNLKDHVPTFSGWDYAPFSGMPVIGLKFAGDYNETANLLKDALDALGSALHSAGERLTVTAANYLKVEQQNAANLPKVP